ncbi:hypothetical protein F5Y08DRAFT_173944 [Xylaria arbuscula]|nr:hypothetical protein F5Y08DRAFT_173944 [Xylaria arbuscula]
MPPLIPTLNDAATYLPRLRYPIPIHHIAETLRPRALEGATTVPQGYGNAPFGPEPGVVAGIVLGSVAGFLLLLAFIYWCINIGQGPRMVEEGSVGGASASVVSWHSRQRSTPRKHHRRSRHSPRHEKIEIRRERERVIPVPGGGPDDQIVVEEFQTRSRERSRPRTVSRGPPPPRSVLSDGEDMIVVEEDRTPPRRRRDSMRSQRTRSPYREDVYIRDVSRHRSRSRM